MFYWFHWFLVMSGLQRTLPNYISVTIIASVLQTASHVPQPKQFWGFKGMDLPSLISKTSTGQNSIHWPHALHLTLSTFIRYTVYSFFTRAM